MASLLHEGTNGVGENNLHIPPTHAVVDDFAWASARTLNELVEAILRENLIAPTAITVFRGIRH